MNFQNLPSRVARRVKTALQRWSISRRAWPKETWDRGENATLAQRRYTSYAEYIQHQRSKLDHGNIEGYLAEYDVKFRRVLADRLREMSFPQNTGASVLCLAARIGTEVKAFVDVGAFAVGIDLNPGPDNHYVVVGDFHHLQYANESIDFCFTNSLDHAYEIERLLAEVRRVLKPEGVFIVEATAGRAENYLPGEWEAFHWKSVDDLVRVFEGSGFRKAKDVQIWEPWGGRHMWMCKA